VPSLPAFASRLLGMPECLQQLVPKEPLLWKLSDAFRAMSEAELAGGVPIVDSAHFALVRGGIWYALDELDAAHAIFQDEPSALGSYWHGMMHRREGDFDNARYWFRRAGRLSLFGRIHDEARGISPTMGRQDTWDPYLFTGMCEQVRFGDHEAAEECARLQRAEFAVVLGHCWEKAVGLKA
jgi:hypothetical protein